jgi:hypothetical protein
MLCGASLLQALCFLDQVAAFFDHALRLLGQGITGALLPLPARSLLPLSMRPIGS